MPRLHTSTSDALDFCKRCWPSEEEAYRLFSNFGDGPDNRGNCFSYDEEHPDYHGEDISCEQCGKTLTKSDN